MRTTTIQAAPKLEGTQTEVKIDGMNMMNADDMSASTMKISDTTSESSSNDPKLEIILPVIAVVIVICILLIFCCYRYKNSHPKKITSP